MSVASTGIKTSVDGSSRFAIGNVPAGTVRLMFKGPSLDGSVQLTGVKDSETIDVKVRVNGSTVSLESEHRNGDGDDDDDDDENEAEIEGTVTSITGTSPALTLIVAGQTVTTTATTVVRMSGTTRTLAALVVGQKLEVEGERLASGAIVARKIQIEDDDDDQGEDEDEVEFTGPLTARTGIVPILTLTVGGRTVLTSASTEIRTRHGGDRLDFTALVVGATLEVKGDRRSDGTIAARRIRIGS